MPWIKTRPLLSPIFSDDYNVYEWNASDGWTTGNYSWPLLSKSYIHQARIFLYKGLTGPFSSTLDAVRVSIIPEQFSYTQGTQSSYFLRASENINKYVRIYSNYKIPSATFSTKVSIETFDENILRAVQSNKLLVSGFDENTFDLEAHPSLDDYFLYYGWNDRDSLDITNNYLIDYRNSYGTQSNPPAPTQSFLFTDRPEISEMAEINFLPFVRWNLESAGGNPTYSYYLIEYNESNQVATFSSIIANNYTQPPFYPTSFKQIDTSYFKFKKLQSTTKYAEVWMGPPSTNLETAKSNRRTKLYTLSNNCHELNNLPVKCLVFQNKFGTFDSYDFIELENQLSVSKSNYDSGFNLEINKSITFNNLDLPSVYIKSKEIHDKQNRITNLKSDKIFKVTTRNIDKNNLKWLSDLIISENVFEYQGNTFLLKPIVIDQSTIQVKSINNIYNQLTFNYTYSQKQRTR